MEIEFLIASKNSVLKSTYLAIQGNSEGHYNLEPTMKNCILEIQSHC